MKHFNAGAMVIIALLNAPLCFAAAGESIKYDFNVVGYCSKKNISNDQELPYMLVQLVPKASYECSELTEEEAQAWFPPRPEVVNWDHYNEWERHVTTVFDAPFQEPLRLDTTNARNMMYRDYDWFLQDENERNANPEYGYRICVPVSLEQNLRVRDDKLSMSNAKLGNGLREQQIRLTNLRVNKIERYRIGLIAEIKGRELCPTIGCQFIELKSLRGLPYILVDVESKKPWEKPDAPEPHHVIPESLEDDPAGKFFDNHIKDRQHSIPIDWNRANNVLDRAIAIWNGHQVTVGDVAIPIVVAAITGLIVERDSQLLLWGNTNFVRGELVKHLAEIRQAKDKKFYDTLYDLQNIPRAVQAPVVANIVIPAHTAPPTKPANRLPRIGGFFAGLGWAGSVWFAAYLLRSYQDGIRIASGCASAAAGMAFLFARHKLAQEGNNHKFWRGVRDGAGVGAVLGGGLLLAHDSPAVQKLAALAARNN